MYQVAAKPLYLSMDTVPKSLVESETALFKEQTLLQLVNPEGNQGGKTKKPPTPEMLDKIVNGKVQKRLAELCLLSQVR
jgi:translation elongation factor EF-Ts